MKRRKEKWKKEKVKLKQMKRKLENFLLMWNKSIHKCKQINKLINNWSIPLYLSIKSIYMYKQKQ